MRTLIFLLMLSLMSSCNDGGGNTDPSSPRVDGQQTLPECQVDLRQGSTLAKIALNGYQAKVECGYDFEQLKKAVTL
jgi:hypothetical protein